MTKNNSKMLFPAKQEKSFKILKILLKKHLTKAVKSDIIIK